MARKAACPALRGDAGVAMMQSADLRNGDQRALFGRFFVAARGRVSIESLVCVVLVVIFKVLGQDSFEMALVEHDDSIEALATDGTDQSLHIRRLPGRAIRGDDFFYTHVLGPASEELTIDRITISK